MGNHRAKRHGLRRARPAAGEPPLRRGRRPGVHAGPRRGPLGGSGESGSVRLGCGLAALAVAAAMLTADRPDARPTATAVGAARPVPAVAVHGERGGTGVSTFDERARGISRATRREELAAEAARAARADRARRAEARAEARALERAEARARARAQARAEARERERAERLARWVLPLQGYRLTARYGEYGSWSTYHTGLDFAAPTGTPLVAIAAGTVTSVGYDGAYGTKTVLTLADGTELWYCHQASTTVSAGGTVAPGDVIGTVGSTGNVTGPHLHLEVRPGGGEPVDPYAALLARGLQP